jgi:hypothetical protein
MITERSHVRRPKISGIRPIQHVAKLTNPDSMKGVLSSVRVASRRLWALRVTDEGRGFEFGSVESRTWGMSRSAGVVQEEEFKIRV